MNKDDKPVDNALCQTKNESPIVSIVPISADRKKITLKKKFTEEIRQANTNGAARTIQVEVRKKRAIVTRHDLGLQDIPAPVVSGQY